MCRARLTGVPINSAVYGSIVSMQLYLTHGALYLFTTYFQCCAVLISRSTIIVQESCAVAKMTAQCALYTGAAKICGAP